MEETGKLGQSARKVCILTETYFPAIGGGETQARLLGEDLLNRGGEVIVITRRSDGSLPKAEEMAGIRIYRIGPTGRQHWRKWGMLISCLPSLMRKRKQYDLILVSGFRILGVPAVLTGRILHKKVILKADSLGEMSGEYFAGGLSKVGLHTASFLFRLFLFIRNKVLLRADCFVAISSGIVTELMNHGVTPEKIHSIPNGVDTARFCPVNHDQKLELRRKLGLSPQAVVITFSGRLVTYKGLPLLIRVWKEVQSKHQDVRLLLVGSGGLDIHNCEAALRDYARSNRLQESIFFTGDVRNVNEYLQASDLFVFPTTNEAFGISLIEAMACGLPVVTTSIDAVKEIVTHKHNGLVIRAGDFQQLHDAICALIDDVRLSEDLGKAALRTVHRRYLRESVAQRYIELFERTVAKPT